MPGLGRTIWSWLGGIFAGLVIVLALLTGGLRLLLAQAPEHRQQIESFASQALGAPLRIEAVDARLGLNGPELYFEGVELLSETDGSVLVQAGSGSVAVNLLALFRERKFVPGRVLLEDIVIEIVRDETGQWLLAGQPGLLPGPDSPSRTPPSGEYRLENATIVFEDRIRDIGPLRFADLEVALDSGDRRFAIEGRTRLPENFGGRLEFWARADGGRGGRGFGRVEYFVDTRDLRLEAIRDLFPEMDRLPSAGTLSVRAWANGSSREIREITAEIDVDRLGIPHGDSEAYYERVATAVEWNRLAGGWTAVANNLEVRRGGTTWRSPSVRLEYLQRGSEPALIYLDADRLRLQDLAPMAFFADRDTDERIGNLDPSGDVADLVVQLDTDPSQPLAERTRLAGRFEGLAMAPVDGLPGISGLTGSVEGDERGGWLELDSVDLTIRFPGLFRSPLTADARGTVRWDNAGGGLLLSTDGLELDNRDLNAVTTLRLQLPPNGPGTLDLDVRARDLDIAGARQYLPVGIMTDRVSGWLDRALRSGRVAAADVVWEGPLDGFPFDEKAGLFRASLSLEELVLDYARGWPAAEGVSANVVFENASLRADVVEGRLAGVTATDVVVTMPDMPAGDLRLEGNAAGSTEDIVRFVRESPIRRLLGYGIEEARIGNGSGSADVSLYLPLKNLPGREVAVDLRMDGLSYAVGPMARPLENISGEVSVRNASVSSQVISASVMGRPVSARFAPRDDGGTRLLLEGRFAAREVEALFRIPETGFFAGEADLQGRLDFPLARSGRQFSVSVSSDLVGMGVELPAPVGKAPAEPRRIEAVGRAPQPGTQIWNVRYGSALRGIVRFDTSAGMRFAEASVHAGADGIRPELSGQPGLTLSGTLDALDLDGWLSLGAGSASPAEAAPQDERGRRKWLAGGSLTVGRLTFLRQQFPDQSLRMTRGLEGWEILAEGPKLAGNIRLPSPVLGESPVSGRLSRLLVGESSADQAESGAATAPAAPSGPRTADARSVPALDLEIDRLEIGAFRFADVSLLSERLPDGFRVREASASGPGYEISSTATVRRGDTVDWSEWALELTSDDVAEALESLGFQPGIGADEGTFRFTTHWAGGLRSDWLSVAEGTARIDLGDGVLEDVEPGAGRVFGLLSVQALPRRLALDFRDVFKSGFQFDEISGDFTIREGQAYTSNLLVRAPALDVGVVGRVGLASRDYDQTAVVSTELGVTLPIAGVLAGGPAVGAALYVIAEIFKEPMKGMVKAQYRITGPWENPQVDRVATTSGGDGDGAG